MVIVEYPIAGVPCQFLSFVSPDIGRRVQKHCSGGVEGGKSCDVCSGAGSRARAAWNWTRHSNAIPWMVL